jgi:hypothetical protein
MNKKSKGNIFHPISGRNLVEFEKVDVEDGGGEVVVAGNE